MPEMSAEQAFATATGHYNAGRLHEAEAILQRILGVMPDQPHALHMLAITMHQLGRGTAGVELLRRAVDLYPNDASLRSNLGAMLASLGELDTGIAELHKAIALNPNFADAHNNLGNALKLLGQPDAALGEYRQAVACRADYAEARNNLGASLHELGLFDEAIAELRRAIQIRPQYPEAHNNLGNVLYDLDRIHEAIDQYRKAITFRPSYPEAHYHLGVSLRGLNRLPEAMKEFRTAVELRPRYPEALWSISFLMLLQGDFANGWPMFEARSQLANRPLLFDLAQAVWTGAPLDGKTILLYCEQGLGDTIQFARYIPMVKARGGRIVVACPSALRRLFEGLIGIEYITCEGEVVPPIDARCSLMSLPRLFQTTLQTIPADVPYLTAKPDLARKWGDRLAALPPKFNIGLVWAGNRRHLNDRNRSVPLAELATVARLGNIRLVSLQKGPPAQDIRPAGVEITDWSNDLTDLAETAALTANLDLVISVDTSVAHLAGAMAKPTWTLLPFAPDWRWMLNRSDSPWYPTMRLFRQPALGEWNTPLRQITEELTRMVAQGQANR
jgi:Flp pilus assembly protein TadD